MWYGAREDWKEGKGKLDRKKTTVEYVCPIVTRENESCSAQTRGVYSDERSDSLACGSVECSCMWRIQSHGSERRQGPGNESAVLSSRHLGYWRGLGRLSQVAIGQG